MGNVDLLISETKLEDSFNIPGFLLPGFSIPFRRDRTANGGGYYSMSEMIFPQKN